MSASLTSISAGLESVARWLRSDEAKTALLYVPAPTSRGGQSSRSGQVSRPTEVAVMRRLDSDDPVERDQRRALELIHTLDRGSTELVDVLVRLGTLAREDVDRCVADGCQRPANARRGLCWRHYDAERGR